MYVRIFKAFSDVQNWRGNTEQKKKMMPETKRDIQSAFSILLHIVPAIDRLAYISACDWFVATNCNNYCSRVFSLSMSSFGCSLNKTNQPFSFVIDFNFVLTFVLATAATVCVTHNHHHRHRLQISCFFFLLRFCLNSSVRAHKKPHNSTCTLTQWNVNAFLFEFSQPK